MLGGVGGGQQMEFILAEYFVNLAQCIISNLTSDKLLNGYLSTLALHVIENSIL